MSITLFITILTAILLVINIMLTLRPVRKTNDDAISQIRYSVTTLVQNLKDTEANLQKEFSASRLENAQNNKDLRTETTNLVAAFGKTISDGIGTFSDLQSKQLALFSNQLALLTKTTEEELMIFQKAFENNARESRIELKVNLEDYKSGLHLALRQFSDRQRENFDDLIKNEGMHHVSNNEKLAMMSTTIEKSIRLLQEDNAAKLEKMRETVDEKLQKTLESRLGESFRLVSERLEAVHKGLGDMQQLASGVGDLKRVLTNVKNRGVLGEYQLENILEQLLTPDQYDKNVKTKPSSSGMVEFAVKLPGKEDKERTLWLPIDSKFPKEDFELLINAYDTGSADEIDECRKVFIKGIKKCAADICGKYIDPPHTTDFAILFLPFESLYAEVLRTPGLFESIQRECKIIITGPTTLSAILSSLQMGFRTLAIEKRSSEVWHLLAAVKTDFGSFGDILKRTHKKLQEASNVIEQAGVRSRAIERKLKDVQQMPQQEATVMLDNIVELIADEDEDVIQ
ncbi:MAG: DNA recombination protein RmuC [Chitinophagaceae bacterium]